MIDILFLAYNRLEFTKACIEALIANTDWSLVERIVIYDDGSTDGTWEFLNAATFPVAKVFRETRFGSPVAIMNDYLGRPGSEIFCKLDNDVIVPPGWLNDCMAVMDRGEVDLLGIEAFRNVVPCPAERIADPAAFIGGIGLMRRSAFASLPVPAGRFGFTEWQERNTDVRKAWLDPALPVCLLNLLPFEPWASLSAEYVKRGWQRPWPDPYRPDQADLWEWWVSGLAYKRSPELS